MTVLTYLQSLNDIIRGSEPTPRCRLCSNHGTRDDGRPCPRCTDGIPDAPIDEED